MYFYSCEEGCLEDQVAQLCYNHFDKLPKKGKPLQGKEWAIISAIIQKIDSKEKHGYFLKIISLGTGSRCVGQTKMASSLNGDLLSDSHAEIIAKRCFMRYLYSQMEIVASGEESDAFLLDFQTKKFHQKKDVSFILFSSHTPCGDASIIPKLNTINQENHIVDEELQPCHMPVSPSNDSEEPAAKLRKIDTPDIYRTGAKCVMGEAQDPKAPGMHHHVVGVLRTKPGRGDQTLSMSCSDKIFKWSILGIQGSLLMNFLSTPIYLSAVVIGKCPFNQIAMERALFQRFESASSFLPSNSVFQQHKPKILQSHIPFKFSKGSTNDAQMQQPCPSSIGWCACPTKQLEVAVDGRKQGVTKKNQNKPGCRLEICRKSFFQKFTALVNDLFRTDKLSLHLIDTQSQLKNLTYSQAKKLCAEYLQMWSHLRAQVVPAWTLKDKSLSEFTSD